MTNDPFWKQKRLEDLTEAEWESLCDGCARCCLVKLEDIDSEETYFTDIACALLDHGTCRCTDYKNRSVRVPTCVKVTVEQLPQIAYWMPPTCAYRLLWEGKDLGWWHPLVSGDPNTVHEAGISVRGRIVSENDVPEAEQDDHIVDWPLWDVVRPADVED